jgi:hypothetical protein
VNVHLRPISESGFTILPDLESNPCTVTVAGSCDSTTLPLLDRFLSELHAAMVKASAPQVAILCEELYFMNSSAIKSFVTWLSRVKALPPDKRYRVTVRTNRFLAWQGRSFDAIQRSAPDIFSVDHSATSSNHRLPVKG